MVTVRAIRVRVRVRVRARVRFRVCDLVFYDVVS
jgi:hypothetical protein